MESSLPQAVPAYSWVPWNLLLNGLNSDCFVDYCPVKHYDDENKHWIFPSRYQALGSWLWPRLKCYWQQFGEFPTPPWQYLPLLSLSPPPSLNTARVRATGVLPAFMSMTPWLVGQRKAIVISLSTETEFCRKSKFILNGPFVIYVVWHFCVKFISAIKCCCSISDICRLTWLMQRCIMGKLNVARW